ncbi:MAG: hypothetical protein AB1391_04470 [Candidatus Micrarchaeota archaeon]
MKEFWNETMTQASWEKLQQLSKEFEFVLIGGWAAYLWTKAHKSKDIDIVVDYSILQKLSRKYRLEKNERLRKYEIKLGEFDIDVYLSHFSRLALPVEELNKHTAMVESIRTVNPETLVILKQGAEIERRSSIKGRKDRIDILTLLICSPFDPRKYKKLLAKYSLENYLNELMNEIQSFSKDDLPYIGMNAHSFAKWKKEFINEFI